MCQVKRIVSSHFRCYRILLRKHQAHDLAKFDIIQEELNMDGIGRIFGWAVGFVVDEVILRYHLDVRVFDIDGNRSSKSNSDGSISGEKCPPNAFPESFVGFAELRTFDAIVC